MSPVRKLWVKTDTHGELRDVMDKLNEVIDRLMIIEARIER
jgi:hypothetical protein